MRKPKLFRLSVFFVLITIILGTIGVVYAFPPAEDGVYRICVDRKGQLRLIYPDADGNYNDTCKKKESMIELPSAELISLLEERINELENAATKNQAEIDQLHPLVGELRDLIDDLEGDVAGLEARVYDLEERFSQLEEGAPSPSIITEDLVLWLPLDEGEGTTVYDQTALGNDGVINGATWVPLDSGYALSFDGSDDYAALPGFMNICPTEEITIECWLNLEAVKSQDLIGYLGGNNRCLVHFPWESTIYWQFGDRFTTLSTPLPSGTVGNWQHWVFVSSRAGNFMKIYQNGNELRSGGTSTTLTPANADFNIAGRPSSPFQGMIGEVRIYNQALTPQQIEQNYQATESTYR